MATNAAVFQQSIFARVTHLARYSGDSLDHGGLLNGYNT